MSTKQHIAYTNKNIKAQLAKGRGRKVVVKLDKAAKEQMERRSARTGGHEI